MRILWHSAAPWLPTGYATQTAAWVQYLRGQGHEMAVSAYYGNPGQMRQWHGIPVYPQPMEGNVAALILGHAKRHKADLLVILADAWLMNPRALETIPTVVWAPVDCDPLSVGDTMFFGAGVETIVPVAMSEAGQKVLQGAGVDARYIPHAIDTAVYAPDPHREALRAAFGIPPGWFAVGMTFNNVDPFRKATPEQFCAFARFHRKHPESVLFAHTMLSMKNSIDMRPLVRSLGIQDAVRFSDQYRMQAGDFTTQDMVRWYNAMDVVANVTMGEGFGLPAVEAQACGTPVILADNTSGPQLVGPGWLVKCEPFWNLTHAAWWQRPGVREIEKALEKAWADKSPFKRDAARRFALKYDIQEIGPLWDELLEETCRLPSRVSSLSPP